MSWYSLDSHIPIHTWWLRRMDCAEGSFPQGFEPDGLSRRSPPGRLRRRAVPKGVFPQGFAPDGHPTVSVRGGLPEGLRRRVSPKGVVPDGLPDGRAEGACAEGVLPARVGTRRSPRRSPSLYIISYVQCLGLKWLIV